MSEDGELLKRFHHRLVRAIERKFRSFTPIQRIAIPAILDRKNIIALAPTAGGKTESALLPVLSNILEKDISQPLLRAIMIAPLKALLNDLEERVEFWTQACGLTHFKWHGDVNPGVKQQAIKEFPDILLTTPESLEVLFVSKKGNPREIFAQVEAIIIDEAHYFAADARGAQLISLIERIQDFSSKSVQRIGLSATVGNPHLVLEWITGSSQSEGEVIEDKSSKKLPKIHVDYLNPDNPDYEKIYRSRLKELAQVGKSIFFNNSKRGAEILSRELETIKIPSEVHHGSLSKILREEAEINMKKKENCVISATSTLELGIDIGNLDRVIQCDNLPSVNSYLQRLGRTGRRNKGIPTLYSIVNNVGDFLLNLAIISRGNDRYSEPLRPSGKRYDILFQQVLSAIAAEGGINVDQFRRITGHAYCFKGITDDEFEFLLKHWVEQDWIILDSRRVASMGLAGERRFAPRNFMELYSVFQTSIHFEVMYQGQQIGILDAWFVYSLNLEFKFRLGGRNWRVVSIDEAHNRLNVEKTEESLPPSWRGGGGFTIEYEVAQCVREMVTDRYNPDCIKEKELELLDNIRNSSDFSTCPSDSFQFLKREKDIQIFTYAGSLVNEIIKIWLMDHFSIKRAESDFACVSIPIPENFEQEGFAPLRNAIREFQDLTGNGISEKDWKAIFAKDGKIGEFSKFSEYLPMEFKVNFMVSSFFNFDEFQKVMKRYAV